MTRSVLSDSEGSLTFFFHLPTTQPPPFALRMATSFFPFLLLLYVHIRRPFSVHASADVLFPFCFLSPYTGHRFLIPFFTRPRSLSLSLSSGKSNLTSSNMCVYIYFPRSQRYKLVTSRVSMLSELLFREFLRVFAVGEFCFNFQRTYRWLFRRNVTVREFRALTTHTAYDNNAPMCAAVELHRVCLLARRWRLCVCMCVCVMLHGAVYKAKLRVMKIQWIGKDIERGMGICEKPYFIIGFKMCKDSPFLWLRSLHRWNSTK